MLPANLEALPMAPPDDTPESNIPPEPVRMSEPDRSQWFDLVERVRQGKDEALEDLYRLFSRGVRYYLCRQLGLDELEDKVHDTFLIVLQAIQRGELRDPDRLLGFIRTVVRRQVAAHIDSAVQSRKEQADLETGFSIIDNRQNPEESAILEQRTKLMAEILEDISPRDREILVRFYIHEETQERICADMGLSETQFRLLKSRAKARFGELGKRRLSRKPMGKLFVRKSAGA